MYNDCYCVMFFKMFGLYFNIFNEFTCYNPPPPSVPPFSSFQSYCVFHKHSSIVKFLPSPKLQAYFKTCRITKDCIVFYTRGGGGGKVFCQNFKKILFIFIFLKREDNLNCLRNLLKTIIILLFFMLSNI